MDVVGGRTFIEKAARITGIKASDESESFTTMSGAALQTLVPARKLISLLRIPLQKSGFLVFGGLLSMVFPSSGWQMISVFRGPTGWHTGCFYVVVDQQLSGDLKGGVTN